MFFTAFSFIIAGAMTMEEKVMAIPLLLFIAIGTLTMIAIEKGENNK